MREDQKQVLEFHRLFAGTSAGCPCPDRFTEMGAELLELRVRLLFEEVVEFALACGFMPWAGHAEESDGGTTLLLQKIPDFEPHYAEMIDALCDIKYVADGAACAMGVDLEPFEDEVHRSNMAKAEGGIRVREDGKILKPDGWKPPDIAGILERVRRRDEAQAATAALPDTEVDDG